MTLGLNESCRCGVMVWCWPTLITIPTTSKTAVSFTRRFHTKPPLGTYQRNPDTGHRTSPDLINNPAATDQLNLHAPPHQPHTHSPHTGLPEINHKKKLKSKRPTEPEEAPSKPTPKLNTRTSDRPSQRANTKGPTPELRRFYRFSFSMPVSKFQPNFIFIKL